MNISEIVKINQKNDYEKKKPNMIIIWLIIGAVLFLAFGSFPKTDKKEEKGESTNVSEYAKNEEKRLETSLEKINGAGDVTVYINIDGGGEKILAKDSDYKTEIQGEEKSEESKTSIVMSGKSTPYIVEEKTPEISGVLVIAKGAADERVKTEIYEAIRAIYGIAPHRIKVTY